MTSSRSGNLSYHSLLNLRLAYVHYENDDRWATKTSGAWNYFVPSFSRPYPSVSRPTSECYKERKNARYAGWACHGDDSFGSFASFVKKVLFTSRPLQIQIEKNLIELFLQQIVKWSPQALKNWYKLYLQILHVNEVFTNGNFFVPHLRDIHLITRSYLRSQFLNFQMTIIHN